MPARNDPESVAYLYRGELSLRDAHPVFVGYRRIGLHDRCFDAERLSGDGGGLRGVERIVGKHGNDGAVPGESIGFGARFAVKRLLIGTAKIGILDRNAHGARIHHHVGEVFGRALQTQKFNFTQHF